MTNCTSRAMGFPACRKRSVEVDFAGGDVTSNGGVVLLREADRRLGLTAASANSQFTTYEVVKPLPVNSGPAAPWFGQPGGATQYQLRGGNVQQMIDVGFIKVVN